MKKTCTNTAVSVVDKFVYIAGW